MFNILKTYMIFIIKPGWGERAMELTIPRTHHIKNTSVVYRTRKTFYSVLSQLFLIHLFSKILITFFTISLVTLFIFKLSFTFLLSYSYFRLSCSYYFLKKLRHSQNHILYKVLQVFLLFVYVTRNTADVTTLYINSLTTIFVKPVSHTFFSP